MVKCITVLNEVWGKDILPQVLPDCAAQRALAIFKYIHTHSFTSGIYRSIDYVNSHYIAQEAVKHRLLPMSRRSFKLYFIMPCVLRISVMIRQG